MPLVLVRHVSVWITFCDFQVRGISVAPLSGALAFSVVTESRGGTRLFQVCDEMLGLAYTVAFVVTTGSAAQAAVKFLAATATNIIRQTHEPPIIILWWLTESTNVFLIFKLWTTLTWGSSDDAGVFENLLAAGAAGAAMAAGVGAEAAVAARVDGKAGAPRLPWRATSWR